MSIIISASSTLLIFFGIVFAAIIVLMVLRSGQTKQKLLSLAIMAAVFTLVYFQFGRPKEIVIDQSGVHSEAYGKIDFAWTDVDDAKVITGYQDTEWKPSVKINGSSFIGFRTGKFKLSNGDYAKIITQKSNDAVIFQTSEDLFLFALDEHEEFIRIASEYIQF